MDSQEYARLPKSEQARIRAEIQDTKDFNHVLLNPWRLNIMGVMDDYQRGTTPTNLVYSVMQNMYDGQNEKHVRDHGYRIADCVDELVEMGCLERNGIYVGLTDKGRNYIERLYKVAKDYVESEKLESIVLGSKIPA